MMRAFSKLDSIPTWLAVTWLNALLLLGGLTGCGHSGESPQEVFKRFSSAWGKSETHHLDALVSENSIRYFLSLQPWIVRGDEESMKTLSPFDQYMILTIRMNLDFLEREDWKEWEEMLSSGNERHSLSGYILEVLEEAFFKTSLGKVDSVNGTTAGQLYRMGTPIGTSLHFTYEEGWKIDLARFLRDRFDRKITPYLSDRYTNRDRVWEMLSETFGERASRSLYRSRIANDSSAL